MASVSVNDTCTQVEIPITCPSEGDFIGKVVTSYYNGSKLLTGVIMVGCFQPSRTGIEKETESVSCGYVWNGGGSFYPEPPLNPSDSNFVYEHQATATCLSSGWSQPGR